MREKKAKQGGWVWGASPSKTIKNCKKRRLGYRRRVFRDRTCREADAPLRKWEVRIQALDVNGGDLH